MLALIDQAGQGVKGVLRQLGRGHIGITDLIDEGAVSPVLKQATHQIGQQFFMTAHRGIDSAASPGLFADDGVQVFTHAVQPLELIACPCWGQFEDRRQGVGIMGGKLRVELIAQLK